MTEKTNLKTFEEKKIEINEGFERALGLLENSSKNVFITGKAGTGKSTLLEYFRSTTKKNVAFLAPTGVAALNVKGQTIHSFFKFSTHVTEANVLNKKLPKKKQNLIQNLDMIVIDEASMLRADLLDLIDIVLRFYRRDNSMCFGGVQMVFIGDLYQLPPVVAGKEEREIFQTKYQSPYFFDAKAFSNAWEMEYVELEKIYRQRDQGFIDLLNKIRNNSVSQEDLEVLNSRFQGDFESHGQFSITLTTTNAMAREINDGELWNLDTEIWRNTAEIRGDFERKQFPTEPDLELKIGAQVMMLNNDAAERWVNGSVGKLVDIKWDDFDEEDVLVIELNNGKTVNVAPHKWEVYKYFFNDDKNALDTESVGSFTQYPLRLAWAVTIHKSQGKTFDHVVIDIGRGAFAHGQVYVALSRCTSFEGLVLKKPILKKHIWMDRRIVNFVTRFQYERAHKSLPLEERIERIKAAIESGNKLEIKYLKANDTKLKRRIDPESIRQMNYHGVSFLGLEAYCLTVNSVRTFRVDRILELKEID